MTTDSDDSKADLPGHGVVVRAKNGDVIRYDPTGLVMRLSDRVIDDIAKRLGHSAAPQTTDVDLGQIDAWDIRQDGPWLRFTARLPGAQGVRGFRRHIDGGDIIADAPGPLLGILGVGGPRAALATQAKPRFPQHVLAAADDIGSVGMAGVEPAPETDRLEQLREMTHEALVGDTLLDLQMAAFEPLPILVTRTETDSSASAAELAQGMAVTNLLQAAQNMASAAALMGKKAKILAICLDYALEDLTADPIAYRDGMLAVMKAIEVGLWDLGFDQPLFVTRFENGFDAGSAAAVIEGQWELSWNHSDHRLLVSAPSYMFECDTYDRPTDAARQDMAMMTAMAIRDSDTWRCPTLFLAERDAQNPAVIRVTTQAASDLQIVADAGDPTAGFTLLNDTSGATVTAVAVAPDDPLAILITCSDAPDGTDLKLAYAAGRPGAVRDAWDLTTEEGRSLARWALPAILPIHDGPQR